MALKLDLDGDLSKVDVTKLNTKTPPAFECDICHKTFTKRVWVERHIGAVHEKKRPFQCHKCDKNFPYKLLCVCFKCWFRKLKKFVSISRHCYNSSRDFNCYFKPIF